MYKRHSMLTQKSYKKPIKYLKGFTLIELLIVVAIIGILAVIAVPSYFSYIKKAREATAMHMLASIREAQIAYKNVNGGYATDLDTLDWTLENGSRSGSHFVFSTTKRKAMASVRSSMSDEVLHTKIMLIFSDGTSTDTIKYR